MKRLLLCFVALLPLVAYAKKAHKEDPAISFFDGYLQCKKIDAKAHEKDLKNLSCEQRVSVHFCGIFEKLPGDVQQSLALEVYCNILAEQQNGEAKHDADIISNADAAGCYQGSDTRAALAEKYKDRNEVQDALQHFTRALLTNEEECAGGPNPEPEKKSSQAAPAAGADAPEGVQAPETPGEKRTERNKE